MENLTTTVIPSILNHAKNVTFSWYDYILFTALLIVSAFIGIYFGCFGSKQSSANEYLMGGKTMKVIPIAVSLVASHVSGITLLAMPADIYKYGAAYWLGVFSMVVTGFATNLIYLPVFFDLQITSTYEYLEMRFDNKTRLFASFLYALSVLFYLPIVVYIPALAFSAATGISVHSITPIVCGICIFYTTIGGLKAVVWTDTLQFTITTGTVVTVFILGIKSAGGFAQVWAKSLEGGRLDIFDFDPNPTKRDSFWIIVIGLTIHWIAHTSVNQSCVQKFLAVPTLKDAKKTVIYYVLGMNGMKTFCVLTGLIMYAKYSRCDPFSTKAVKKNDQLLPYYVMDVASGIPGLSGLFIAGIFSAALSTLSATLNCLSGTIYKDFISKLLGPSTSDKTISNILKVIVLIIGVVSTASVFLIEKMGGLLPLAIALQGITNGPMLGVFTLGILFPKAHSKGAFYGTIIGLLTISCIGFTSKYYETHGLFRHPSKPVSTDGCAFLNSTTELPINLTILDVVKNIDLNSTLNIKMNVLTNPHKFQPHAIFRISHYYYSLIGAGVTLIVGLIVSYVTKSEDPLPDKKLLSPIVHSFCKEVVKSNNETTGYHSVEKALSLVTTNSEKN